MFKDPVHFHLTTDSNLDNPSINVTKLLTYLNTVDGVRAGSDNNGAITIRYEGSPIQALLRTNINKGTNDAVISNEFLLTCERADNIAINLLRNAVASIGYRIFNPTLSCFLVNELNLVDLTTIPLAPRLLKILKVNNLEPVFQYRGSLVFYAKSLIDNSIHLVNNHLLLYFLDAKHDIKKTQEISIKVATNIAIFVALFDRGVIPTSFYKVYLYPNPKIVNLNGFDFEKLNENIFFTPIFFKLDKKMQLFKQINSNSVKDFLEKGTNVVKHIEKTIKKFKLSDDFIVAKIASNIDFENKDGKLYPRMTFSIFMT